MESAAVCPGCNHHLRFGKQAESSQQRASKTALRIEGTVRQPTGAAPCEYSVIVEIKNERGERLGRHVVGVGSLQPQELRSFTLSVDLLGAPK